MANPWSDCLKPSEDGEVKHVTTALECSQRGDEERVIQGARVIVGLCHVSEHNENENNMRV